MRTWLTAATFLTLSLTVGCSDAGVAAIRIQLAPDFSGTVITSSLLVPPDAGPLEGQSGGASWTDRANLYSARGTFASLSDLRIADISFSAAESGGIKTLSVTIPRGDDTQWPTAFIPRRDDRQRVSSTFDPQGNLASATTHFSIEVELPAPVISSGVVPKVRGMAAEKDSKKATLIVPVDRTAMGSGAFEWHVTWK